MAPKNALLTAALLLALSVPAPLCEPLAKAPISRPLVRHIHLPHRLPRLDQWAVTSIGEDLYAYTGAPVASPADAADLVLLLVESEDSALQPIFLDYSRDGTDFYGYILRQHIREDHCQTNLLTCWREAPGGYEVKIYEDHLHLENFGYRHQAITADYVVLKSPQVIVGDCPFRPDYPIYDKLLEGTI